MAAVQRTRRPGGRRRRRAILEAALRVIAERGVTGATHRAVAEAAEVPLSTTTYYFASLDELLDEALLQFVRDESERLRALSVQLEGADLPPAKLAELLLAELRADDEQGRSAALPQFELYLEASRRPSLRAAAAECLDLYTEAAEAALRAAGAPDPERGARAFVGLIDGLGLHRIADPRKDDDALVRDAMLDLFIAHAMGRAERASWRKRLGA